MTIDTKRMEKLIFFLDLGKKEFRSSISDVDNNTWSTFEHKDQISEDLAHKIVKVYSRINLKWLFYGEGYVVNKPSEIEVQKGIYLLSVSTNKLSASTNKSASTISMWIQIMCWIYIISFAALVLTQIAS